MKQFCYSITLLLLLSAISSCNSTPTSNSKKSLAIGVSYSSFPVALLIKPGIDGEEVVKHDIYLDDKYIGNYNPSSTENNERVMFVTLREGDHSLRIVSKGFETQVRTFTVIQRSGSGYQLIRFDLVKE